MTPKTTPEKLRRDHTWLIWLGFTLAGFLLVALRTPGSWSHQQFYAEDGVIFFQHQAEFGWHSIFKTYSGYFHLIPRLIAALSSMAPAAQQPTIYAGFTVLVQTLAAGFFILPQNRTIVRSDWLRFAVSVLTLIDFQAAEMLNTVANMQWYVVPVAILMLGQLASGRAELTKLQVVCYCVLMAIIGLTAPTLNVVIPLALFVLCWRARGFERFVPITMIATAVLQAITFQFKKPNPPASTPVTDPMLEGVRLIFATVGSWAYRGVLTIFIGEKNAKALAETCGSTLAFVLLIGVILLCRYAWKKSTREYAEFLSGALFISVGLICISVGLRDLLKFFPNLTHYEFFGGAARYYYASGWLTIVTTAIVLDRTNLGEFSSRKPLVLFGLCALGIIQNYRGEEIPKLDWASHGPAIDAWIDKRKLNQKREHLNIPIIPNGWGVDLPEKKDGENR